jgi:DNA-binding NarL/FixJ family response regulator
MTLFDLTPREMDVVRGVVSGKTNREIADELGLTLQAVKNVLSAVFEKCRVRNRVELAVFALRHLLR